jgi:hypothetical protein
MNSVSVKAEAPAFRHHRSLAPHCGVWTVILLTLTLTWGCAGVSSGKTAQTVTGGQAYAISGTISPSAAGTGATLTLSGVSTGSTTADSSGNYTFSALANGTYVVAPSHTGYAFAPGTQAVTISGAAVTGVNFTATAQQTYSISGTISPVAGGAGATVTLSGPAGAMSTSDSAGNYSFTGLLNGNYTVTPTSRGFAYSPASQSVSLNSANLTAINFTATPQATHTVSLSWSSSPTTSVTGYNVYRSTVSGSLFARVNSAPIGGLVYTDSTVQNGLTYYFVTTAVDPNGESVFSNQVPAVIP